jgi:cytochrome P450
VDEVLGARTEVTNADLARLEYTGAAFKETMRLWPPLAGMSRQADHEIEMNGVRIPKGAWVYVSEKLHLEKIHLN